MPASLAYAAGYRQVASLSRVLVPLPPRAAPGSPGIGRAPLLVGVLVRGDLEGFFLIIMISLLDTFLENPMENPLANQPILEFFPSYGVTQFAGTGVFHHQALASMMALSLAWTAAFALLGLVVLRLRLPRPAWPTRAASAGSPEPAPPSHQPAPPHHQPAPPSPQPALTGDRRTRGTPSR